MGLVAAKKFKKDGKTYVPGDKISGADGWANLQSFFLTLHLVLVPDGAEEEFKEHLFAGAHPRSLALGYGLQFDNRAVARAVALGHPLPEGATLGKAPARSRPEKAEPKKAAPSAKILEDEPTKEIEVPEIIALGKDEPEPELKPASKKKVAKKKVAKKKVEE